MVVGRRCALRTCPIVNRQSSVVKRQASITQPTLLPIHRLLQFGAEGGKGQRARNNAPAAAADNDEGGRALHIGRAVGTVGLYECGLCWIF